MKVKPLNPRAVEAARRVLADAGVLAPRDIDVEAIAARHGAMVLYGPVATARAAIVRAGRAAVIRVDERARGRPWARFTIGHELGHHLLHEVADHFVQCTGDTERPGSAWLAEREASDFATEFVMPESMATPRCAMARPTVEDVEHLASIFTTSFEASAIRMVELTRAPCAVMVAQDGVVKWALESRAFPGRIVKRWPLDPKSVAARLSARAGADAEREVPGEAWLGKGPFLERAMRTGPGRVTSWIAATSSNV